MTPETFWSKVIRGEDCWEWVAARTQAGYGRFSAHDYAHRYSWELHNGPIPEGMFVCHRCDNPPCVRPDHLFVGTARDNVHDAVAKGRFLHGETSTSSKLTTADVIDIRHRVARESISDIARRFGVERSHIRSIVAGRRWAHVPLVDVERPDPSAFLKRGANHPHVRLTPQSVSEIRARHKAGETFVSIARSLSLGETTVRRAVHGRVWTDALPSGVERAAAKAYHEAEAEQLRVPA